MFTLVTRVAVGDLPISWSIYAHVLEVRVDACLLAPVGIMRVDLVRETQY